MLLPVLNITTSLYDIMDDLQRKTILGGSSEYYHLACALGALLCAVYLVQISAKILSGSGGGWTPWDLLKPIVILVAIENFSVVTGVIDGTIGVVCRGIAGYTEDSFRWQVIDDFVDSIDTWNAGTDILSEEQLQEQAESKADESGFLGISLPGITDILEKIRDFLFDSVKTFFGVGASFGYSLIAKCIATIAEWIGYVVFIFSKIYLLVLTFIGPFSFAISIIPTFQRGVGQWVARYIQISFWYPILQVINLVYTQLVSHIPDLIAGAEDLDSLLAMETLSSLLLIFISVAVILMYFSVPKVASWLIQSTGANHVHSNVSRAGTVAMSAVTKGAV